MIYILVPTFARINQTRKFLISIQQSIEEDYLVLIVDDHPEKVTFNNIEQNKNVKILLSEKEIWWVGSINLGIEVLFKQYDLKNEDTVVFANNDVQIDINSFKILQNNIKKNKNQIIHPRTFDLNDVEVSSGTEIFSFFPYITRHPKKFIKEKEKIDMGTARFLMMSGSVLRQVGYINPNLVQYGGDNDFTLSAKRNYNIKTYILRDANCRLDDSNPGMKISNINSFKELYKSFFSIKSPNNFGYRYELFKKFFGSFIAFFITVSMTFNTIIKFIIRKK